jgi:hypothetical protein
MAVLRGAYLVGEIMPVLRREENVTEVGKQGMLTDIFRETWTKVKHTELQEVNFHVGEWIELTHVPRLASYMCGAQHSAFVAN